MVDPLGSRARACSWPYSGRSLRVFKPRGGGQGLEKLTGAVDTSRSGMETLCVVYRAGERRSQLIDLSLFAVFALAASRTCRAPLCCLRLLPEAYRPLLRRSDKRAARLLTRGYARLQQKSRL